MKKIIVSTNGNATSEKKQNDTLQKKLAKVQKLKQDLETLKKEIKKYQRVYNEHLKDQVSETNATKEIFISLLFKRLQQKSFSQKHRFQLEEILQDEIEELRSSGYSSQKLDEINNKMQELHTNNMTEQDEEILKHLLHNMANDMGVDLDENIDIHNYKEHFEEAFQSQQEAQQQAFTDQEKATKTAHTDKDFYKLYKSLAKKAHPDLVSDLNKKEQREEWMKELSEVWSNRNYVGLLQLSQKITGQENNDITIASSQYKSIIKQLNKEIKDLESQKYIITKHDPDFAFYYQNFKSRSEKALQKKITGFKADLEENLQILQNEILRLKTQKSTKTYLDEIFRQPNYFEDDQWY